MGRVPQPIELAGQGRDNDHSPVAGRHARPRGRSLPPRSASAPARPCGAVEITHKTSVRQGPACPASGGSPPGQRYRSCYTERQPGGRRHACGARYTSHRVIKGGTIPRPCARKAT